MADNKATIYVDVDDEITAIIDKVKVSDAKVVALVLPKRASMLQSIVNLKLLKRSADSQKKNLVLITTETALLPLAGAVGIHVAKSLSSAPEIPAPPLLLENDSEAIEEDMGTLPIIDEETETPDLTKDAAAGASVGALADAAAKKPSKGDQVFETLDLKDSAENDEDETKAKNSGAKSKAAKNKHLKVPNFNRFRVILLISVLLIAGLIVLAVFAFAVWPRANILIKTDASTVSSNLNLTLDPQAQSVDTVSGDIPAKQVSEQKTFTQSVPTTGQKNEGNVAVGQVTLKATDCYPYTYTSPPSIPAGTGISYNNLTFITQNATTMSFGGVKGSCISYTANGTTNILAQSPGTAYNVQIVNGNVAGYPEVVANGSASGGTDNNVPVVSQTDINTATAKITSANSGTVQSDLSNQLKGEGLYPIEVTLEAGTPQITSSPNVGDQGSTVTVTEIITYTMFGVKQSDLNAIVDASISSQTSKNQNIISTGVTESSFKQIGTSGSTDQVSLSANSIVGPNISADQIKKEIRGKSAQAAISVIKQNPDVTGVTIKLSPFYLTSVPGNLNKITVVIAKPSIAPSSAN